MISYEMTEKTLMSGIQDDIKQRGSQLRGNRVLVSSKKHDEERFPKVSAFYAPKIPHTLNILGSKCFYN